MSTRSRITVVLAMAAAAAVLAPAALAADDPNGFVRNRVPADQTLRELVAGQFYEEVRCLERCKVVAELGIAPADARRLGFGNVDPKSYYVLARVSRTLPAGTWTKIRLPLGDYARARVAMSTSGVKVAGRLVAHSTTSKRKGSASWTRTCRIPPQ